MENWQIVLLDTDISTTVLGEYFRHLRLGNEIKHVKGVHAKKGIYENQEEIEQLMDSLLDDDLSRKLVMYGNGFYHHYTYGLCKHADRFSDDYAYIHFDHHPDYRYSFEKNRLGCGSFVERIVSTGDTNASTALFIGSEATKLVEVLGIPLPIPIAAYNHIMEEDILMNGMKPVKKNLSKLPHDVYLSFDLDVMDETEIRTDYSRGSLKAGTLLGIIETIKQSKRIIGADILGFADTTLDIKSAELYLMIAESLLEA